MSSRKVGRSEQVGASPRLVSAAGDRPFLFLPNRTFSSSSSSFSLLQHLPYRHCVQHLYNQSIILNGAQNEYIVYDAAIR